MNAQNTPLPLPLEKLILSILADSAEGTTHSVISPTGDSEVLGYELTMQGKEIECGDLFGFAGISPFSVRIRRSGANVIVTMKLTVRG